MINVVSHAGPDVGKAVPLTKDTLITMLQYASTMLTCPGGHADVQNALLGQMNAALADSKGNESDIMRVMHSMIRRHVPDIRKMREVAIQPGKTAAEQRMVFSTIREQTDIRLLELDFIQLLCEGHNKHMQNFLRDQGSSSSVNILLQVIDYIKEIADAVNVSIEDAYIQDASFVSDFIARCSFHTYASKSQRVVGWYLLKESEISLMVQQLKLLKGAVDTLTEFVQGPNEINQLAVIQADLLKRLQPIFELASCMNLSGVLLTEDQGRAPERWSGGEVMLSLRAQFRAITVLQK
eukprot:2064614-Prymnesium_polylepis.1